MERVPVITDIHANLPALEACREATRAIGVDEVYCGGDLVGYGPRPNEVCSVSNRAASLRSTAITTTRSRATLRTAGALFEMQLHADWAITLACGATCPYIPTVVEDWDVPDPAGKSLAEVRTIRDEIEGRVRDLVDNRLDLIRSDRTAHQLRLEQLLGALGTEFEAMRSPEEIRVCADAILGRYEDVPVRSHVLTIAERKTRECLRTEHCEPLAV